MGLITKITYPDDETIEYSYDPNGHVLDRTDQRGWVTEYEYDKLGHMLEKYCTVNNITTECNFTYDGLGRMLTAEKDIGNNNISDSIFTYSDFGKTTTSSESLFGGTAKEIGYQHDQMGNLVELTYPDDDSISITRNPLGRIAAIDDPNETTVVEYKYIGPRVARRKYPVPDVKYDITYDNYGRAIQHYTYIDSNDIVDFLYAFDDNGNITSQKFDHRPPSPSNFYAYDNLDRLIQAKYLVGNGAPQNGLVSRWNLDEGDGGTAGDSAGDNDGTIYNALWTEGKVGGALDFDGNGDYVEMDGYKGITGGNARSVSAWIKTTDSPGDILSWGTCDPGQKWMFEVHTNGRLKVGVWGGYMIGSTAINDDTWHHVAAVLGDDGSPDVTEVLLYVDGDVETVGSSSARAVSTDSGDDVQMGQLDQNYPDYYLDGLIDDVRIYNRALSDTEIAAMIDYDDEQFTYDKLGNRTTLKNRAGNNVVYAHNNVNEYTAIGGNSLTHDNAGNMTECNLDYTYEYDYENRLTSIEDDQQNLVAEYAYDALGRRIEKIVGGVTTRYYYDGWRVLTEVEGSNSKDFVYGNYLDEVLMMIVDDGQNQTDHYYAHDHLYSPAALIADDGTVEERYEYDAYGKCTILDATFTNTRSTSLYDNDRYFTGQMLDAIDSGNLLIMYYKNRYYLPDIGRFVQRDPARYSDGMNLYEYVQSKPVIKYDPDGKVCKTSGTRPPKLPRSNKRRCVGKDKCCFLHYAMTRVKFGGGKPFDTSGNPSAIAGQLAQALLDGLQSVGSGGSVPGFGGPTSLKYPGWKMWWEYTTRYYHQECKHSGYYRRKIRKDYFVVVCIEDRDIQWIAKVGDWEYSRSAIYLKNRAEKLAPKPSKDSRIGNNKRWYKFLPGEN